MQVYGGIKCMKTKKEYIWPDMQDAAMIINQMKSIDNLQYWKFAGDVGIMDGSIVIVDNDTTTTYGGSDALNVAIKHLEDAL